MTRQHCTKTIINDYGEGYVYEVYQHPAEEGFNLMPTILRFAGEAGAPLLKAVMGGALATDSEEDSPVENVSVDLTSIDFEGVGKALSHLATEIVNAGGPKFCLQLLKYTIRRPVNPTQGDEGMKMSELVSFNKAYQGNYGELFQAVWFAMDANYGPCLRARLEGSGILQTGISLKKQTA